MAWLLLLPLFFAAGGATAYGLALGVLRTDGPAFVARAGGYVQLFLTVVALAAALLIGGSYSGAFGDDLGLSGIATGAWVLVGIGMGAACFGCEIAIGNAFRAARRFVPLLRHSSIDGGTSALQSIDLRITTFACVGVGLAIAEELLWRQVLIGWLLVDERWSTASAVALSAVLFGINHYWFGVRNVIAKAVDGAAWGSLLVVSGSLLAPVAAHITFQSLVWRRLHHQRMIARRELVGAGA